MAWFHVDIVGVYPRYLLFNLALLDVLGKDFVMLCGECWMMILGFMGLLSPNFCRNTYSPFLIFFLFQKQFIFVGFLSKVWIETSVLILPIISAMMGLDIT